jgi:hypothetical protein
MSIWPSQQGITHSMQAADATYTSAAAAACLLSAEEQQLREDGEVCATSLACCSSQCYMGVCCSDLKKLNGFLCKSSYECCSGVCLDSKCKWNREPCCSGLRTYATTSTKARVACGMLPCCDTWPKLDRVQTLHMRKVPECRLLRQKLPCRLCCTCNYRSNMHCEHGLLQQQLCGHNQCCGHTQSL